MRVTESIRAFLQARKRDHNNPSLLDQFTPSTECQINVHPTNGEPVDGRRNTYTDGVRNWFNIRIPKDANTESPVWDDYDIPYPLDEYGADIGLSGWDWQEKRSRWVGFDFDAAVGHADGLTEKRLEEIKSAAQSIPWVEVRRSTSGRGLHIVAHLDAIPTRSHTEHAALARAVLEVISRILGFDLQVEVDAYGGILWVWSRRATKENQGFASIKAATATLSESVLSSNWRDHIDVVTRRRAKVKVHGVQDQDVDAFDGLTSARPHVPLDKKHKAVIEELTHSNFSTVWIPDYHLLQTHTKALQDLIDDPDSRTELGLRGLFKTISDGKDPGTPNCFAFPLGDGAWKVYRFSPGVQEADTWEQDSVTWTSCYFNTRPDLPTAARALSAAESAEGFAFDQATDALEALRTMGENISLPEQYSNREARLKRHKDGRIVLRVQRYTNDQGLPGWVSQGGWWERVSRTKADNKIEAKESTSHDGTVRVLIDAKGEYAGSYIRSELGTWDFHPQSNCKMVLQHLGNSRTVAESIMGGAIRNRWMRVCIPFGPEYPGNRQWNIDAPQLVSIPADTDEPQHPMWDAMFKNWGRGLDKAVKENKWCAENGIKNGANYLLLFYATMIRRPDRKLPYLFFWGDGNTGKSSYHESFKLLVTGGVADAKRALAEGQFNGEMENCVLAHIDEHDLSKHVSAVEKIKEWVTGLTISIRRMRTNQYTVPSYLHFVQCGNDPGHCKVLPKDCRIVVVWIGRPENPVEKEKLQKLLKMEAPQFLRTLLDLTLPPPDGRMGVAVLETDDKRSLAHENEPVNQFVDEKCKLDPAAKIVKSTLYDYYREWCTDNGVMVLTKPRFGRKLLHLYTDQVSGDGKATENGQRHDCYTGITLADAEVQQ